MLIGDKHEIAWPAIGVVNWLDAETGRQVLVDTSDKHTRKILGMEQTRRVEKIDEMLKKAGIVWTAPVFPVMN